MTLFGALWVSYPLRSLSDCVFNCHIGEVISNDINPNMISKDIRNQIIAPALKETDTWSEAAEILIYGTGWVESSYKYEEQIGHVINGGLGYWQEEPTDFHDAITWLKNGFDKRLSDKILAACDFIVFPDDPMVVITNTKFACLLCRVHYWRVKEPLPSSNDAHGMAQYHKTHYNSSVGAANVDRNTQIFQQVINGAI